nr:uncharacterized protein LOC105336916 isoform X2 [Crassostrea gigas]
MAESKKTELEIHREMMTLLSHLREKKTRVRKKVPMAQTSKQEIKADVRKILEQFLKKQQLNDDEEEGAIPTGFQREDVENVTETYRSGSTNTSWEEYECLRCEAGCRSKVIKSIPTCSNRSPTDDTTNFTFIDEYEHDVERSDKDHSERSNSPPFSDKIPVYGAGPPQRLQSGTESETDNTDYDEVISPNEDAEKIAEGRARPATGLQGIRVCEAGAPERLQSGTESETAEGSRSRARPAMGLQEIPVYGAGRPQRLQSGTESETDDTDYDEVISPNEDAKIKTEGTTRPAMWPQGILVCEAGAPERLQYGTESETDDTDFNEVISSNEDAEKIAEGRARPAMGLQEIPVYGAGPPQRLQSGTESETDDTDYDEVISPNEDAEKIAEGRARPAMWLQGIRVCEAGAPERLQSGTESETAEGSRSRARPAMGLQEIPVYGAGRPQRLQSGTESETAEGSRSRARPAMGLQEIPVYGAGRPQRLQSGTESETDDTDYDEVISPNEDAKIKTEGTTRPAMWPQGILVCEAGAPERLQSGTESETDDTDFNEVISSNEDAEKIAEGRARPAMGLQEIPVYGAGPPQRLQSGTESETDDTDYNEVISPNEDAEKIAEGRARPAIGRQRLVSRTESDTDDTDFGKEFISLKEDIEWIRVGTARGLQRLMSETEPKTDDTDYEEEVISRKKDIERREVGAAKPAIGRQRLMSGTESDTDDNDYRSVIIKRWKSRKKKDIDSSVNKRGDVVQNVHTHKISHVEQHNYTNGNKSGMLMESEVWECKDLAGKSEHKHGERHSNIRETMRPRHATSGRTSSEKDRLYTAVAEKLAHIGDHYKATSPLSDSTRSSVDNTATRRASARTPNLPGVDERGSDGLTALERQLIDTLREVGDSFQLKLSPNAVKEIVKQAMYQRFQEVVDKKTGPGNSWDHIAAVFYLTKKVVTMAGVGRAVALQVKDLAAEYVADKFATWIVDQGGWDTFLDSDSDLD